MDTNNIDPDELKEKLIMLDALKAKVDELSALNNIGDEIRNNTSTQDVHQYKELHDNNGLNIEHMNKQFKHEVFTPRPRERIPQGPKTLRKDEIEHALSVHRSGAQAARSLGVAYYTLRKYAKLYGIEYATDFPRKKIRESTYHSRKEIRKYFRALADPTTGRFPIEEILAGKFPNFPLHRLKDKLIRSGIKKAECELCGFSARRASDGKFPLLLHSKDGNIKNHKLENLQIVCYNCAFLLNTYIKKGPKIFDPEVLQGSYYILEARF